MGENNTLTALKGCGLKTEHAFSDWRIIKEVVQWSLVNELIPPQLTQCH